jgi:phage gp46-like protein
MASMTDPYSGDPKLFDSGNGGDLMIEGGQPVMDQGLNNSAYISHFMDPNWWGWSSDPANPEVIDCGNLLELTKRANLTPAFLNDAEAAAKKDLAWMLADGVAKSVECSASILAPGIMGLIDTITEPDGTPTVLRWKLNWAAMREANT